MQLRKCCNHPYLFVAGDYNMWRKEEIARASGKFELLDRLLPKLHRSGHRVLLFSQMTRLLDILEIYLQLHNYKYLRLDGNTKTESRGSLRAKQKMGIDAKVIQAGLFNTTSTAQDSRQMLEQIMRRGTSSLGTDVPSEREINRLAARSDDEFWLFEKMDEERRQKEKYRSRLMEEHEVPEWAYSQPEIKEDEGPGVDGSGAMGKRKRKDVRPKSEEENTEKHEYQGPGGSNWNGHLLTWNTHKKKRSSFVVQSTLSDSRGQNSNGRGSGWT
ncbi:putative atp-dependent dna helicase chr12 [Quercus suber]|uniref:Atp-dependent dna helicase chr12 n=1 Tax=Quercus suber TaxID=58331 RepID=A0AAW0MAA5_QUESU